MADFENALGEALPRGVPGKLNNPTDASWADTDELGPEWTYSRKGILLGSCRVKGTATGIGWKDDRHVMTVAGSRAGKGVSLMVPNLLLYEGSVLAIDPKGELARTTSRVRAAAPEAGGLGQKVFVLDPFEASLKETKSDAQKADLKGRLASFNPLAELDPESPNVIDDAGLIADALIIPSEFEPHWGERAKEILQSLILMVLILPMEKRNLAVVRDMLALRDGSVLYTAEKEEVTPLRALFKMMQTLGDQFEGVVASTGTTFLDLGANELASILSTAQGQTKFLDSPGLRRIITKSDFCLADLKTGKATLYLCLPAGRMPFKWG